GRVPIRLPPVLPYIRRLCKIQSLPASFLTFPLKIKRKQTICLCLQSREEISISLHHFSAFFCYNRTAAVLTAAAAFRQGKAQFLFRCFHHFPCFAVRKPHFLRGFLHGTHFFYTFQKLCHTRAKGFFLSHDAHFHI